MSELVNRIALPQAHLSVNGFDTGHRDVFSTKAGIALPVVAIETVPDGHYEIDAGNILRTSEMQTASFVRMKQNLDFYYVPYSQLYGRFDDVLFDKKDPHRSRLVDVSYKDDVVPYFPYYFTILALYEQYIYCRIFEQIEEHGGSSSSWLFSLPYGDGTKYLAILVPGSHNVCIDERGEFLAEDFLRTMDLMGFGNWLPIFKNLFNEFIIRNGSDSASSAPDYYVQKLVGTNVEMSSSLVTSFGVSQIESMSSLNDYSLVAYIMSDSADYNTLVRDLSILPFAAYQKIWCDFYRNSTYDQTPFFIDHFAYKEYPFIYNFDGYEIAGKGWQTYFTFANFFMAFLRPRERQWKKDLFTGLFPDAQSGDAAIANINADSSVIGSSSFDGSDFDVVRQETDGRVVGDVGTEFSVFSARTSAVGISALSIRYANALQAYREMIVRAGNKHKDLQLAEYGKVSKYTLDDYAIYIGSYDATIDVNTVTATAETQDINLGQLGANGISTLGGKKINFHSNEFGIIIGIYSILPQAEYEAFGINKLHTRLKQFDFYHPKFANLGFSPVFQFEFNASRLPLASESFFDRTLGFTARDHEYKCAFDKVHGEFFGSFAGIGEMEQPMLGTFSDYCAARRSDDIESDTLDKLYVDGHCLDRIFYSSQNWHQSSDHFKVNMYFDIKSVLPMPVSGLPNNQ